VIEQNHFERLVHYAVTPCSLNSATKKSLTERYDVEAMTYSPYKKSDD